MATIIETKQEAVISSQYIQYTKILQMPSHRLREVINEELKENPLLELPEGGMELQEPIRIDEYRGAGEEWDGYYGKVGLYGREETLADYLISQLKLTDSVLRSAAVYIIHLLDDDGWLREPVAEIAETLEIGEHEVKEALRAVQGLEPAGVGAGSLAECLELQLARYSKAEQELCLEIVREYLPELGEKRYAAIAKKLAVHKKDVEAAAAKIRKLNPRPGMEFSCGEKPRYVVPDLVIQRSEEGVRVSLVKGVIPELRLNQEYIRLLKESKDAGSAAYMKEYLPRARKLNDFVAMRNVTLLKIAGDIAAWQEDFFRGGDDKVVPMTLADIAEMEGMHEATISRAVSGKYVMTDRGIYALSEFFSRPVAEKKDGEQLSAAQIQKRIREILRNHQGPKHLSDQKIADMLETEGIHIARRTVAKYRRQC